MLDSPSTVCLLMSSLNFPAFGLHCSNVFSCFWFVISDTRFGATANVREFIHGTSCLKCQYIMTHHAMYS